MQKFNTKRKNNSVKKKNVGKSPKQTLLKRSELHT